MIMDDPFACFGSDSDGEDINFDNGCNEDELSRSIKNHNGGKRLKDATNKRQTATNTLLSTPSLIDHVPILSPNDYEVFSCSNPNNGYEEGCYGVRAKRCYKKGELILSENPIIRINTSLVASSEEEAMDKLDTVVENAFRNLSPISYQNIMKLSSCRECEDRKSPFGIFQTNNYQLGKDSGYSGVFLTMSRFNHSCRPNANHYWRPDLHSMNLYASRDIGINEELCTMYGPMDYFDTERRRSYLEDKFSFHCMCEMCREGNQNGGDDNMKEIQEFHDSISFFMNQPNVLLQRVNHCLNLMQDQGKDSGQPFAFVLHYGYQACIMNKKYDAAYSYLERELSCIKNSQGETSYRALDLEALMKNMGELSR